MTLKESHDLIHALLNPLTVEDTMLLLVYSTLRQDRQLTTWTLSDEIVRAQQAEMPLGEINYYPTEHYSERITAYLNLLVSAKLLVCDASGSITPYGNVGAYSPTRYGSKQIPEAVKRLRARKTLPAKRLLKFLQTSN
jgi:hypothetical protein